MQHSILGSDPTSHSERVSTGILTGTRAQIVMNAIGITLIPSFIHHSDQSIRVIPRYVNCLKKHDILITFQKENIYDMHSRRASPKDSKDREKVDLINLGPSGDGGIRDL